MKIGDEVFVHGYVDEIRKDVIIIRNDGGYFGTVRSEIGSEITLKTDKDSELDRINNELDDAYARIRELTADTPQNEPMKTTDYCDICKQDMCEDCIADATNPYCVPSHYEINYEPKDEPQIFICPIQDDYKALIEDEPQPDCAWK